MEQLYTQMKSSCLVARNFTQSTRLCRLSSTWKVSATLFVIALLSLGLTVRTYADDKLGKTKDGKVSGQSKSGKAHNKGDDHKGSLKDKHHSGYNEKEKDQQENDNDGDED